MYTNKYNYSYKCMHTHIIVRIHKNDCMNINYNYTFFI